MDQLSSHIQLPKYESAAVQIPTLKFTCFLLLNKSLYALHCQERKHWGMNQSSNRFLPVVYGFKPTVVYGSMPSIYALMVIEHKCTNVNQSSNGFAPTIYDFCLCRVPYSMLSGQDMLHDQVWCYATMICCYVMSMHANTYQTTVETIDQMQCAMVTYARP